MSDPHKRFNLSEWALNNQQMVSFLMMVVVVMGVLSYINLPRNEDPSFTIKKAVVSTVWPGASVKDTTQFVTDVVEKKLQEVPYLDYLKSYTREGESVVFVNLRDDTPPKMVPEIWYQVRKKMKDLSPSLPAGASEPAVDDEFDDTYGTIYGFTGTGFTERELRDVVDRIRDRLLSVADVSKIKVLGAQDEQINIAFSPEKLAGLGLSLKQVTTMLQQQNAIVPAGVIRTGSERIDLQVSGAFKSEKSLQNIVLHIDGDFVPLTQIATIHRVLKTPPEPEFRVNGQPAIGLAISMSKTGNMLDFGQRLDQEMDKVKWLLPHGMHVFTVANQSKVVKGAVNGFVKVLVEAIVIVLAVSFISLGMRAGLVVAFSIPIVLAMTFVGMEIVGIGLQRISLGALIIALGLLVDDAMITVETMVSRLEQGWQRKEAAVYAFKSTAFPMLTGTLVMVSGFIPVGFAASSAGEYCYSMFVVVLIALSSSWIVAILFSPLLGVWLLPRTLSSHKDKVSLHSRMFRRLLSYSLSKPKSVILLACVLLGLSIVGMGQLKSVFFPSSDRPELLVDLTLPQNATQSATREKVIALEKWLKTQPNVAHFSSYVGSGAVRFYLPMDVLLSHENVAELVVVAKSTDVRDRLSADIKRYLNQHDSDIVSRVAPLELGPPVGWPVRYRIMGPDLDKVRSLAMDLSVLIGKDPQARDINLTSGEPERRIAIDINQTQARAVGLSSEQVANTLANIFSGDVITSLRDHNRMVNVVVQGNKEAKENVSTISNLQIPISNGQTVPLRQIATIQYGITDPIVWRWNREPYISVQLDAASGELPQALSNELAPIVQQFTDKLPAGYQLKEAGAVAESSKGNRSVYDVLPVTILCMLTLLMIQLRRFSRMLLALFIAPFGLIGVVIAMLPTGTPMGFVALLGIIALFGMIIRNTIILISEVDRNVQEGVSTHEAITRGAIHRSRPILLTACAAILGMVPISREVFWQPMAYAIIGGLFIATLITLLVLPAALKLVMQWESARRGDNAL